jgi:hypothetical protein
MMDVRELSMAVMTHDVANQDIASLHNGALQTATIVRKDS